MAEVSRIAELIFKQLQNDLSPQEQEELDAWTAESSINRAFVERMSMDHLSAQLLVLMEKDDDAILEKMRSLPRHPALIPPVDLPRIGWNKGTAAAMIVGLIGCLCFFSMKGRSKANILLSLDLSRNQLTHLDRVSTRATLKVADGETIFLDEHPKGIIWEKDGWRLSKTDSHHIEYMSSAHGLQDTDPLTHTFSIPYGQSWGVLLPDRSQVELNAGSSLSYLVGGWTAQKERDLQLRGEALIHVAENGSSSFTVTTAQASVKALATVFDVRDYARDKGYRAAVIRGAVRVETGAASLQLNHGQAAIIDPDVGSIKKINSFDTTKILAWRSGYFDLSQLNVKESLLELAQWYGMDKVVIYQGVDTTTTGLVMEGEIRKPPRVDELLKAASGGHLFLWREGSWIIASSYPQ
jgi:transmembrane sensor